MTRHACVIALVLMFSTALYAAEPPPPGNLTLKPIKETLTSVQLNGLAAVPVQHGGRYKPLYSLAMEVIDGISCSTTFHQRDLPELAGHTPLSSLLDLLFCRSDYDDLAIARVKNTELRHDLALVIPEGERVLLLEEGRITPRRITDQRVRDELEKIGRLTTKIKAINQVRLAQDLLAPDDVAFQLRLFPVPSTFDDNRWRSPAELGADVATSFTSFVAKTRSVPDESRTDTSLRPALDSAIIDAIQAWHSFGEGWRAARHGILTDQLQSRLDAFVAANNTLQSVSVQDRAARGEAPLILATELELTYWQWQRNIIWVALGMLLAVPFLAVGGIGGQRWALFIGYVLLVVGFSGQVITFIIRAELAQRIPLSNLYESMAAAALLAAWIALLGEAGMSWSIRVINGLVLTLGGLLMIFLVVDFIVGHHWAVILPAIGITVGSCIILLLTNRLGTAARGSLGLGASLFGCLIIVAQILLEYHDINAFISPAMPILSEFWLRVHTSCIIASYSLIALGGLMSLVYLTMRIWLPWNDARSEAWDRTTFAIDTVAMLVLWVGLVLGAVWAAVSWGRPWGWDPKEVFALLTWVVYIGLVHLRVATSARKRGLATAVVSIVAFVVMVFNWYWVNIQLAGLHSYAMRARVQENPMKWPGQLVSTPDIVCEQNCEKLSLLADCFGAAGFDSQRHDVNGAIQ